MNAEDFYHEEWEPEYLDGNMSMLRQDAFRFAEAYHRKRIKDALENLSDEAIESERQF